jgi:CBS domain-containing protein
LANLSTIAAIARVRASEYVLEGGSSPDGLSIQADDSLVDAGNLMIVTRLRSVPVAEGHHADRKLVGMLSRGDVLRGLRSGAEQATDARDRRAG